MQEAQEVQKPKPRGKRLYLEIAGIIMIALGAYGLVSLHSPAAGVVGQRLAGWIRWCLGQAADLLPCIVIVAGILIFRGRAVPGLLKRTTGFLLLAVSILVIIHLQTRLPAGMEFTWRIRTYGDVQPTGTGAFGHFLSYLGLRAFGPNGTYIFLIAFLLIGLILLFDRGLKTMGRWLIRIVATSRPSLPKRERGSEDSKTRVSPLQSLFSRRKLAHKETAAGQAGESKELSGADYGDEIPTQAKNTRQNQPKKRRRKKAEKETEGFVSQPVRLEVPGSEFELPSTALLSLPKKKRVAAPREDQSSLLEDTLKSFGIECQVTNVDSGPVITRYEVRPARGTKVSRIVSLADDLALSLAAPDVRIEAPVPGKAVVGIEVPNRESSPVYLREVLESSQFINHSSKLALALGKDIVGKPVIADLRKLLHLLIAGATGSGKSVCLNAIIASILYKATPDEVKIVMIDPKRVELANYNDVPHLISPVVTDPKKAAVALRWAVGEMEQRYQLFSATGTRNIDAYNQLVQERMAGKDSQDGQASEDGQEKEELRPLPYIVIIIDELADLMLVAGSDVEDSICRLAQMARAAGMYLIIATQRPSVDVITGLIKANIPSRIAFAVSSQVDSRTILDMGGAERLLGKGDMLFFPIGANKAIRAQGAFISDRDVENLVDFWKSQGKNQEQVDIVEEAKSKAPEGDTDDELFPDAVRLVRDTGTASISMLQRRFRIGYARAARLIDMMEVSGIVGPYQGSKPREVIMSESEIDEFLEQND